MYQTEEIWKDIPLYEGSYQASSFGRIKSLDRYVNKNNGQSFLRGKIIKQSLSWCGYYLVGIRNGKRKTFSVHRLIAKTFLLNPDNKKEVNHINGIKNDNRLENLEWCTPVENTGCAWSLGLCSAKKGEKNGRSKLTDRHVRGIRAIFNGKNAIELSKKYKVHLSGIHRIVKKQSWKHI